MKPPLSWGTRVPVSPAHSLTSVWSTRQLDLDARGFSFRPHVPLDMRMSGGARGESTASDLLNTLDEAELGRLFRSGEEPRWRRLARAVVLLRADRPFRVAGDLIEATAKALQRSPASKDKARVFQALRIAVNQELESLGQALPALLQALLPGGVVSVIAYESMTDRTVKQTFAEWSRECICPPRMPACRCRGEALGKTVVRRVVRPTPDEVTVNPRARSARLRSWRKAA